VSKKIYIGIFLTIMVLSCKTIFADTYVGNTTISENTVWDVSGSPYILNGYITVGRETYTDIDGDGNWDDCEPLNDLNGNGTYDEEPFKLTISSGVTISTVTNKIFVDGILEASDVICDAPIEVRSEGHADLDDCSLRSVKFYTGSSGSVVNCTGGVK